MGAEPEELGNNADTGAGLSQDVVESNKVQERGGSYTVSIPKESAQDLGIQKGDQLLFLGKEGEDKISVQPAQAFLEQLQDER